MKQKSVFILHKVLMGQVSGVDDVRINVLKEWLSRHHNEMPKLSDNLDLEKQDWKTLLTFDDGYQCNYNVVIDLLEQYSVTAIFFVVSDYIGEPGYITECQLRTMSQRNFLIGSHTVNHVNCSKLSEEEFVRELQESKYSIEKIIQKEVRYFSFPYGCEYNEFNKKDFNIYELYFNSKPGPFDITQNIIGRYPLNSYSKGDTIEKITNQKKLYIFGYSLRYRIKEVVKFILPLSLFKILRKML
jgi:peptidoglycan/xylan/chitin deacetylase (PgdA/CDA1 family)